MASSAAQQIITKAASEIFRDEISSTEGGKVKYELKYNNPREYHESEELGNLTFTLTNPIAEEEAAAIAAELLPKVDDVIANNISGKVTAALLAKAGTTQRLRDNIQSSFEVRTTGDIAESSGDSVKALIRTSAGRLITRGNLRTLLDRVMKEHLLKSMTTPRAGTGKNTPLRNRTGRFMSSATVADITIGRGGDSVSLYYKYLVYPYQVFDPVNTQSPDMGLASRQRNPQKLIGDALLKAARTQLHEKYKVFIGQTN